MWRGGCRSNISVSASFVWRCLSGATMTPFPHPSHRTGHEDFPHPALGQERLTDELARIEGGPWAEWGSGRRRKPITQNALARLLRPHHVSPVDVLGRCMRDKGCSDEDRATFDQWKIVAQSSPERLGKAA